LRDKKRGSAKRKHDGQANGVQRALEDGMEPPTCSEGFFVSKRLLVRDTNLAIIRKVREGRSRLSRTKIASLRFRILITASVLGLAH